MLARNYVDDEAGLAVVDGDVSADEADVSDDRELSGDFIVGARLICALLYPVCRPVPMEVKVAMRRQCSLVTEVRDFRLHENRKYHQGVQGQECELPFVLDPDHRNVAHHRDFALLHQIQEYGQDAQDQEYDLPFLLGLDPDHNHRTATHLRDFALLRRRDHLRRSIWTMS